MFKFYKYLCDFFLNKYPLVATRNLKNPPAIVFSKRVKPTNGAALRRGQKRNNFGIPNSGTIGSAGQFVL